MGGLGALLLGVIGAWLLFPAAPAVRVGPDERHLCGFVSRGHGSCSADDPLDQAVEIGKIGEGGVGALPARSFSFLSGTN
jgi:hypothetical protein